MIYTVIFSKHYDFLVQNPNNPLKDFKNYENAKISKADLILTATSI